MRPSSLTIIYFLALILFVHAIYYFPYLDSTPSVQSKFMGNDKKLEKIFSDDIKKIRTNFDNPIYAHLGYSYLTGYMKGIPKNLKNEHRVLTLQHLFTPSGVHLTSLLIPINFVLNYLARKMKRKEHFFKIVQFFIMLLILFIPGLYPLKRMALLRIFFLIAQSLFQQNDIFKIFLFTFLMDFIWGTYQLSPLSFTLSFLFLGCILALKDAPKLLIPLALWGGQLMTAYFLHQKIYPLAPFFSLILSTLFIPIFPLITLSYITHIYRFWEWSLILYTQCIHWSFQLATKIPSIEIDEFLLLLPLLISLHFSHKSLRPLLFATMIFFHGNSLNIDYNYFYRANLNLSNNILTIPHEIDLEEVRMGKHLSLKKIYSHGIICYENQTYFGLNNRCLQKGSRP